MTRHPDAEALFDRTLRLIDVGCLTVRKPGGIDVTFGRPDSALRARWIVRDPRTFDRILRHGSLGLGESYMDGWWDVEEDRLIDLFGILVQNRLHKKVRGDLPTTLRHAAFRLRTHRGSRHRARENIRHHYDLGNAFFRLFLDESMTYTCGIAETAQDTLSEMQQRKLEVICRKLDLKPGERLLDIGCGWGGLAVHAARHHGVRAVGITLSQQQLEHARAWIRRERLEVSCEVRHQDYREVPERAAFHKLASVGMFEAVSLDAYPGFFRAAHRLLAPDGVGLLHTIGTTEPPGFRFDPWITTYIFPGARIPRLQELIRHLELADLTVIDVENLRPHYAETLQRWKQRFDASRQEILALGGYDERFLRMWNYYLQMAESGFRHGRLQLYQILFHKGTRWPFSGLRRVAR